MRLSRIPAAMVAAGFLVFSGCGDNTAPVTIGDQAAFDFSNGPATPGQSGVERFDGVIGLYTTRDPSAGYVARHWRSNDWEGCGGSESFPLEFSTQGITAHGVWMVLARLEDSPIYIYPYFGGGTDEEFCEFLADGWLYSGTHDLQFHDNNYPADPSRAVDSWGWRASGVVYDHDGNAFRYSENQHWQYETASGTFEAKQRRIRVRRMR